MESNPGSKPVSSEPVGFIGLGAMGAPMARHLASRGFNLLIHDLNAPAVQSVVALGARSVPSAREIASQAKIVFTCLPSLEALRAVTLGKDGLYAGDAIETYVDLSTTGSEFAQELAASLREHGIMMLDSPITGSVATAGNGRLGIMCSGPLAGFKSAEPIMREMASAMVLYLGEQNGRAQTLKLLNNLLSATGMATTCEAFVLGVKGGLDPQVMLDVFNAGESSTNASRNKFARSVLPRTFDYGARMAITAKDISLAVHEATELGIPMWIGQSVQQIWKYAVSQGAHDKDGTALITYLEPWAGVEVRGRANPARPHKADAMPANKVDQHVLVCDAAIAPAIETRLRKRGFAFAVAGAAGSEQAPCCIVEVPAGSDAVMTIKSLRYADSRQRTILNACLIASTEAAELSQAVAQQGVSYLDALLTGTYGETADGSAALLVGGSITAYENAKPLLEALGSKVFYVSLQPGAAQLMQQLNGAVAATLLGATCESYVTGAKAGLDPITMTKILGIETGRTTASARIIPEQVATRKFNHGRRVAQVYRELSLASDEARQLGVTPWILDKTRLLYGLALQLGSPDDDVSKLATHYEKWAGIEIKSLPAEAIVVDGGIPSLI